MRRLVSLLVVALIVGVGFALYRGAGPLPDPKGCRTTVGDVTVRLDPEQGRNAAIIAAIGVQRGLPARAVSIALATAFQESKLRNLDHGDRDSLGIFQQRPSQGWGTAAQVQDPFYSTNAFYEVLAEVDGFETMRITEAAQKVQRSAYPEAYEPHAADARALASALTGFSPGGRFTCVTAEPSEPGTAKATIALLTRGFGSLQTRTGPRQDVSIEFDIDPIGKRKGWAVAQFLVANAEQIGARSVSYSSKRWQAGSASQDGWTEARTDLGVVTVTLG